MPGRLPWEGARSSLQARRVDSFVSPILITDHLIVYLHYDNQAQSAVAEESYVPLCRFLAHLLTFIDFRKDWQRYVRVHFDQVIPLSIIT